MKAHAIRSLLRYAWDADTIYDVHAPKAFRYLGEVIEDERHFHAFDRIARVRDRFAASTEVLNLTDHGAGSHTGSELRRKLSDVASTSGTPDRFGRYLFKTVDYLRATRVLELGTNVGLGSCYLASALPLDGRLISLDADPQVLAKADWAIRQMVPAPNFELRQGKFVDTLAGALEDLGQVDLAFIDGHHAEQPTKDYYTAIAKRCHANSIIILDDIHWSEGMEAAWAWVQQQPNVTLTLDLYRWGVVFFDPQVRVRQHLTVCPWRWKPWHMGFFKSR